MLVAIKFNIKVGLTLTRTVAARSQSLVLSFVGHGGTSSCRPRWLCIPSTERSWPPSRPDTEKRR